MKTKKTPITAVAMLATVGLYAAPISIDTVVIGNANNPADTRTTAEGGTPGLGRVSYEYNIGTTAVTAGQYTAFLNAVATTGDTHGLYNVNMVDNVNGCGITANTVGGVTTYTATKGDNMPVNYVSVYDAMRFCNWLTTGNTEVGVYMFSGTDSVAQITRNSTYWTAGAGGVAVASLDEWYKAAFYQGDGTYSMYANGTNTAPTGTEANFSASGIGSITDVDFGVASYYNTFGQNGNVWEWAETISSGSNLYIRGGSFTNSAANLAASYSTNFEATVESNIIGFRVVSLQAIPEPSTYAAIFGALALALVAYRRRK